MRPARRWLRRDAGGCCVSFQNPRVSGQDVLDRPAEVHLLALVAGDLARNHILMSAPHAGDAGARRLLTRLADGAEGSWQSREAKAVLTRLARCSAVGP